MSYNGDDDVRDDDDGDDVDGDDDGDDGDGDEDEDDVGVHTNLRGINFIEMTCFCLCS